MRLALQRSQISAEHVGHGVGVGFYFCRRARGFGEVLSDGAERGGDEVAGEVASMSGVKTIDLSGKTTIAEAVALLAEVDVLVANDMGLAHIAPAVDTRTVVIFGPTDPTTTRPYSDNADILKYDVECSPCMLRDCPIDHRCMTNVTVADAFDRVVAALYPEENEQST